MRSSRMGWGLLAPTLIILAIIGLIPFFYVIYIGFFDWNIFSAKVGMVFAGRQQLPAPCLRQRFPVGPVAGPCSSVLGGRERVRAGLPPGPDACPGLPRQGLLPNSPRPALDDRSDRGRSDLAAADDPRLWSDPVLPIQVVRHRLQHRAFRRSRVPDGRPHGHLALDALRHAVPAGGPDLAAQRAARTSAGRWRKPLAGLPLHHASR